MGREVRRVPPNWQHPTREGSRDRHDYQPMYKTRFADAIAQWLADFDAARRGEFAEEWARKYYGEQPDPFMAWLGGNPPPKDEGQWRPWTDEEATWFQVWETVSEGTPITPPFASEAELVTYLRHKGDFWRQREGRGGYSQEAAEEFVSDGWAPSMVVVAHPDRPPEITMGIETAAMPKRA